MSTHQDDGHPARQGGEDAERPPPAAEPVRERYRGRRRQGTAHLDAAAVEPRREARPSCEAFLHRDGRDRAAEAHPDADPERDDHDQRRARDHGAHETEHADQRDRHTDPGPGAEPADDERRRRRKQPHAENRDRAEQPDDRVRDVQVVLDRREERPGTHDLRAKRQTCEKERDQRASRAHLQEPLRADPARDHPVWRDLHPRSGSGREAGSRVLTGAHAAGGERPSRCAGRGPAPRPPRGPGCRSGSPP